MRRRDVLLALVALLVGVAAPAQGAEPVRPTTGPAVGAPGDARSADLVLAEDARLLRLVTAVPPGGRPYTVGTRAEATLVLPAARRAYGLADLVRLGAVRAQTGASLLVRHVLVARGATLDLRQAGQLRMTSGPAGFTSLVAWGRLSLTGDGAPLQVTSWDPAAGGPDREVADGRAYVRTVGGRLDLRDAQLSDLGFWSGRTGGAAWTGSSGSPATGTVQSVVFDGNHLGAFLSRTSGVRIGSATFRRSAVDGLAVHREARDTSVVDSTAQDNGRHGFAAARGARGLVLERPRSLRNRGHGVLLDGRPLSRGISASGASPLSYGGSTVQGGTVAGNGEAGVAVLGGNDLTVRGVALRDNGDGVRARDGAVGLRIEDNVIASSTRYAVSLTGGQARVSGNRVDGARTAVHVRDGRAEVTGNTVAGARDHGVSVVGASGGSRVAGNAVTGRGPSAVDVERVAPGHDVRVDANAVQDWHRDRDNGDYLAGFLPDHPLLALWALLFVLPLGALVRSRRRPGPAAQPYAASYRPPPTQPLPGPGSPAGGSRTRVTVLLPR